MSSVDVGSLTAMLVGSVKVFKTTGISERESEILSSFLFFFFLFMYLYFNHTEPRILYPPPLLSLRPQGLNNFKKYLKSCNKITSKEMGRGMGRGSGITKGVEKRGPLPRPPRLDSSLGSREKYPLPPQVHPSCR